MLSRPGNPTHDAQRRAKLTVKVPSPTFEDACRALPPLSSMSPCSKNVVHPSIAFLTCMAPLNPETVGGDSATLMTVSSEVLAVGELIATMKRTLGVLGSTFDSLSEQTQLIAQMGSAFEINRQVQIVRRELEEQYIRHQRRVEDMTSHLHDVLTEELADRLRARVDEIIHDAVQREVGSRVREELQKRIPSAVRQQVKCHQRQLLRIRTDLHNSEARQYNALLRPSSVTEPLRPLLRPHHSQSPLRRPSKLLQRTVRFTSHTPPDSSTIPPVPSTPVPTPLSSHEDVRDDDDDETLVGPSPLFPRDLATLFSLDPESTRALLIDYGLSDSPSGEYPLSAADLPSGETTPGSVQTHEEDLNRFMAHIGIPFKMIPPRQ